MKNSGRKRKLITSLLSMLLVAALLISGTFAWLAVSQFTNEFRGEAEENPGGTGHDDFCEPNKDVYVENWGETDIFVRVRLDEYMEIGEGAGLYIGSNRTTQERDPANFATSLIDDATIYTRSSWEPHVPYNGDVTDCNTPFHDYWRWTMGGQKWYMPSPSHSYGYIASDVGVYNPADAAIGAQQTLPGRVITMQAWHDAGKPIGQNFWVVDVDGWAYWAQPLRAGTATGLLLDSVNLINPIDNSYYYAINILYQMASRRNGDGSGDYNNFGDNSDDDHTWTEDGHDLMDSITGNGGGNGGTGIWGEDHGVTIDPMSPYASAKIGHRIFIPQGGTVTLKATVTDASAGTEINWIEQPQKPGFTFADTNTADDLATVTIGANVAMGTTYPVRAEAADDASFYSKKTIVVIPAGSTIVDGGNGKVYICFGDNTFRDIREDGSIGDLFCGGVDETPGTSDDRDDVVIIDGEKYLPSLPGDLNNKGDHGGETGWSWAKDGDGKLGTSDDVETNLGATPPPPVTITSIAVAPVNVTLAQGAVQQFTATATLSDGTTHPLPASQITWELSPTPNSASTILSTGGLLTIGANETTTTLYVYATLNANTAISGSATVTVQVPQEPTLKDIPVGDTVNLDGWEMVKLAQNGDYALFMTAGTLGSGAWNTNSKSFSYNSSTIKTRMDNWFTNLTYGGEIRTRAMKPTNVGFDYYGTGAFIDRTNVSAPTTTPAGNTNAGIAFPASEQELRNAMTASGKNLPSGQIWTRTYGGYNIDNGSASPNYMARYFSPTYGLSGFSSSVIDRPTVGYYKACVWLNTAD
jgi:hypothetical protein